MAFPVSSRSTGTLITASIWNNDLRDTINALYAGALALPGQAAWDFVYASSPTQMSRMAAEVGKYPKFVNGVGWQMNVPTAGWHQGFVPASAIVPCATNPCGWHERITLSHASYYALAFSGVADNWAGANVKMPPSWNESTCYIYPIWLSMSGNAGNVSWVFYGNAISNSETGNWTAASGGSILQPNYGPYLITSAPPMTFAPASVVNADNYLSIMIIRQGGSDAADTFPDPAYLLGFTILMYTDADVDA